jgi:hypothetical protein
MVTICPNEMYTFYSFESFIVVHSKNLKTRCREHIGYVIKKPTTIRTRTAHPTQHACVVPRLAFTTMGSERSTSLGNVS